MVTAGLRRAALEGLAGRAQSSALDLMGHASAWSSTLRLNPISEGDLTRVTKLLRGMFVWTDDGYCAARATLGAHAVTEAFQGTMRPRRGVYDAVAGVAHLDTDMSRTGWFEHEAVVVRVRGRREPQVIDLLTSPRPMPLSQWKAHHGVREAKLLPPLGEVYRDGTVGPIAYDRLRQLKEQAQLAWTNHG